MDTINDLKYFSNNSGLCGMQIRVKCPEDELTTDAHKEGDDIDQESWFMWAGVWIGFPLGFILSVLIALVSGYFVLPPPRPKHQSIHYSLYVQSQVSSTY